MAKLHAENDELRMVSARLKLESEAVGEANGECVRRLADTEATATTCRNELMRLLSHSVRKLALLREEKILLDDSGSRHSIPSNPNLRYRVSILQSKPCDVRTL